MKKKETPETYTYIYNSVRAKARFYTLLNLLQVERNVINYCHYKDYDTLTQTTKNSISIIANQGRLIVKALKNQKGIVITIEMNDFDTFIQQFLPEKHKEYFNLQKHKWGFNLDEYKKISSLKTYLDIQKDDGYGCLVFPSFLFSLMLLMLIWGLIFQSFLGAIFVLAVLFLGLWYAHKMAQQVEMDNLQKRLQALGEEDTARMLGKGEESAVFYILEELGEGEK